MKWAVLVVFFLLVPVLVSALRSRPVSRPIIWGALGFLPLVVDGLNLDVAPVSWAQWTGYIKGIEVTLVDVVALAIVISRPRIRGHLPFVGLWLLFAFTSFLSVFQSQLPTAALFAVWQALRITLIFLAAASICDDEQGPRILLTGMSLGLALNAGFSIFERATGTIQAAGLYSHQNMLGMVSHFIAFPAAALLLAGVRWRALLLGVGAAITVAILSASRGTIGLAGAGYITLLGLSLVRYATPRKWKIAGIGAVAMAIAAPLAISSLTLRFDNTEQTAQAYDERAAFEQAAKAMINDHPMGQGANQYVLATNTKGYSDVGGVGYAAGSRSTNVHHSYLLVTAEQGYLGLVAFIALLAWPMLRAYHAAFATRRSTYGELLLGCAMSISVVMLHVFYEWVFVTYEVQTLFALTVGIIAGLLRKNARPAARVRTRPTAPDPVSAA